MRMNIEHLKGKVEATIGSKNVPILSAEEWAEFVEIGQSIVKMHNAMIELLPQSLPSTKDLNELAKRFSKDAMDFAGRYTFGKDARTGEPINFLTLLGELRMAHVSAAYYVAEFYVACWAAEHKINTKLRNVLRDLLLDEDVKQRVPEELREILSDRKDQYITVPIKDNAPS